MKLFSALASFVLAATLTSISAVADDVQQQSAPASLIAELTQMCVEWAQDDEVATDALRQYVLQCVNEELTASDYLTVTEVDI
ncbi:MULTISPECIES: hypothetical protein [Pseudoalteromonas]|uniref:Uncharacterized protein n=1 Tax=Pseudoalteromonas rubra TaxID=43658 RepID=A0A5S3V3G8_9GAMM|nr:MULTISPECIES: hypothetical protein [Pseudoalteromonas]MCG7564144.1 hypothetical protein [Pseudoalteromonas sp. McH1-42]MEC4087096.1 hypothetical protein [Pseudoalteromonas rubra]QPB83600.1 hypothetical protein CWC22_011615 [Pseudoalteromonas rubra]